METVTIKGVVQGRTIQLEREPGLPDGQKVTVTMKPADDHGEAAPGEGLKRGFGGWAEDGKELDEYLEWSRQQRRRSRKELEP
jgi:hypothetical protein